MTVGGVTATVDYEPGESTTGLFGGNSNWRGPVWFPVNLLLIRTLLQYYAFYGNDFQVECPTGSGKLMNLYEGASCVMDRLNNLFLRDGKGKRAVFGGVELFQSDPHWRDLIPFYEFFHGDNGAGIGASHQTGWTGLVAKMIELFGLLDAEKLLEAGRVAAFTQSAPAESSRQR